MLLVLNNIQYDIQNEIGFGGQGTIHSAVGPAGCEVVIKRIELESIFFCEMVAAKLLANTNNICKIYNHGVVNGVCYLVMDRYKEDLFTFFDNKHWMVPECTVQKIFLNICIGLKAMHEARLAHLDLKPENVLINSCSSVAICDFGSSRGFGSKLSKRDSVYASMITGSDGYSSPEMASMSSFDPFKSDIYSLGILLHVLLTGNFPPIHKGKCKPLRDFVSPEGFKLLSRMTHINPKKRPAILEILKHSYLKTVSSE